MSSDNLAPDRLTSCTDSWVTYKHTRQFSVTLSPDNHTPDRLTSAPLPLKSTQHFFPQEWPLPLLNWRKNLMCATCNIWSMVVHPTCNIWSMVMHPTCNIWSMVMLMQTKVWLSPSKPASSVSSTSSPLSIRTLGKTHTQTLRLRQCTHIHTDRLRQHTPRHWKKLTISSVWVWACRHTATWPSIYGPCVYLHARWE